MARRDTLAEEGEPEQSTGHRFHHRCGRQCRLALTDPVGVLLEHEAGRARSEQDSRRSGTPACNLVTRAFGAMAAVQEKGTADQAGIRIGGLTPELPDRSRPTSVGFLR